MCAIYFYIVYKYFFFCLQNFIPSVYLNPNGSIPVSLTPELCTAGCIILNTTGVDLLC